LEDCQILCPTVYILKKGGSISNPMRNATQYRIANNCVLNVQTAGNKFSAGPETKASAGPETKASAGPETKASAGPETKASAEPETKASAGPETN